MSRNIPKQLQNGLVMWLDSAGKDLSGNGNNGTLVNAPTKVRVLQNDGLNYNGSNQYVTIPDSESLYSANEMSFSGWFYLSSISESYHGKDNVTNREWALSIGTSVFYVLVFTSSGYSKGTSSIYPVQNKWTHICFTRNSSGIINIYKDSILVSGITSPVSSATITNATTPIEIGRRNYGPQPGYLNGQIINPMVYNRALSPQEVQLLHKSLFIK